MATKKTNKKKQAKRRSRLRRGSQPKLDPNGIDIPFAESLRLYQAALEDGMFDDDYDPDEIVLRMHPDFLEFVKNGRTLPDEVTNDNGDIWNPRLHLSMHSAVESQLVRNEPDGIFEMACGLEKEGKIGSHQIRHAIVDVFAGMVWAMQKEDKLFDPELYLKQIPERYRVYAG